MRCLVVGDVCVGKICFLKIFVGEKGDEKYILIIFENYYGKFWFLKLFVYKVFYIIFKMKYYLE